MKKAAVSTVFSISLIVWGSLWHFVYEWTFIPPQQSDDMAYIPLILGILLMVVSNIELTKLSALNELKSINAAYELKYNGCVRRISAGSFEINQLKEQLLIVKKSNHFYTKKNSELIIERNEYKGKYNSLKGNYAKKSNAMEKSKRANINLTSKNASLMISESNLKDRLKRAEKNGKLPSGG